MEKYRLSGTYERLDDRNLIYGQLEFITDNYFKGEILFDTRTKKPFSIEGNLCFEGNKKRLIFIKDPSKDNLTNIVYSVVKNNGPELIGKYFGEWQRLPYQIEFNNGIFNARIDFNDKNLGGPAKLCLYK